MRELWNLEQAGWEALCGTDPRALYDHLLTDDAVMIVPGMMLDRDATLASWDGVAPWQTYEFAEQSALPLGPDTVALIYQATARRTTTPPVPGDHHQHLHPARRLLAAGPAPADAATVARIRSPTMSWFGCLSVARGVVNAAGRRCRGHAEPDGRLQQQGVDERLGQVAAQLALLDVVLLGVDPGGTAGGPVAFEPAGRADRVARLRGWPGRWPARRAGRRPRPRRAAARRAGTGRRSRRVPGRRARRRASPRCAGRRGAARRGWRAAAGRRRPAGRRGRVATAARVGGVRGWCARGWCRPGRSTRRLAGRRHPGGGPQPGDAGELGVGPLPGFQLPDAGVGLLPPLRDRTRRRSAWPVPRRCPAGRGGRRRPAAAALRRRRRAGTGRGPSCRYAPARRGSRARNVERPFRRHRSAGGGGVGGRQVRAVGQQPGGDEPDRGVQQRSARAAAPRPDRRSTGRGSRRSGSRSCGRPRPAPAGEVVAAATMPPPGTVMPRSTAIAWAASRAAMQPGGTVALHPRPVRWPATHRPARPAGSRRAHRRGARGPGRGGRPAVPAAGHAGRPPARAGPSRRPSTAATTRRCGRSRRRGRGARRAAAVGRTRPAGPAPPPRRRRRATASTRRSTTARCGSPGSASASLALDRRRQW